MKSKQLRTRLKKAGKETGNCLKNVAWQTCKCVLWTACAPCLCCALLCLPRRRCCGQNPQPIEYIRPQFPAPRPRALSLPLIEAQENQITVDQPQSDFMTKLPLEIRRMIYEHALGGATIHLMTYDGKPSAKQCWREKCRCDYFDPLYEKRLSFGLALLRTCRLVYSEAIEYLYTANTFSLSTDRDEVPTVNYLSYFFLPQRLAQIRDLRIHWQIDCISHYVMSELPTPHLEPWFRSWDALSRLTGLRRLHIDLEYRFTLWSDYYEQMWKERGNELLGTVRAITAPRDFVITLPNSRCTTNLDVGASKCVLKLPEGEPTAYPPLI